MCMVGACITHGTSKHEKHSIVHWTAVWLQFDSNNANLPVYCTWNFYLFCVGCHLLKILLLTMTAELIGLWPKLFTRTFTHKATKSHRKHVNNEKPDSINKRLNWHTQKKKKNWQTTWKMYKKPSKQKLGTFDSG